MTKLMGKIDDLFAQAAEAEYGGSMIEHREISPASTASYGIVEQNVIATPGVPHAEAGDIQAAKSRVKGHGEQAVLPDDCQFGDNELCYVES